MLRDSELRWDRLSRAVPFAVIGLVLVCGLLAADPEKVAGQEAAVTTPGDASATAQKDAPASKNILSNPGAETGEDYADDWIEGQPIDGVKYVWDKHMACEGKASLCIKKTINRYFPIAAWSQTVKRTGDLPLLEVSAQVKTKKMFKAILDVTFLKANDQPISHKWAAYIGAKDVGDPPANHDWKKYSGTVEIPPGTAKICIGLQDYGPGTVWFDDVQARYATAAADIRRNGSEALRQYQKALQSNPRDAEAHRNLGNVLAGCGRSDEALAQFRQALEIKPDDAESHRCLGVALAHRGRFDEAMAHYRKAVDLNPDCVEARQNLAWALATCPQASLRNGTQALEHAVRANRLCGGKRVDVLDTLAAAYAEAGWFAEAVAAARKPRNWPNDKTRRSCPRVCLRIALYENGKPYRQAQK